MMQRRRRRRRRRGRGRRRRRRRRRRRQRRRCKRMQRGGWRPRGEEERDAGEGAVVVSGNGAPPKPNGGHADGGHAGGARALRKFAAARRRDAAQAVEDQRAEAGSTARASASGVAAVRWSPRRLARRRGPTPNRVPPWLRGGAAAPPPPWARGHRRSPQATLSPGTPTPPWAATRGPAYAQNVPS